MKTQNEHVEQKAATGKSSNGNTIPLEKEGKYLTFLLKDEEYGIAILKVREIIGMIPVTKMPQAPPYVKGVINLRGKVIPVIDLRLRFDMEERVHDARTCIIVVEIKNGDLKTIIGIVVDSVSEVLSIKNDDVEDPPGISSGFNSRYIMGLAKMEGGVKLLLDIDEVLTWDELAGLKTV